MIRALVIAALVALGPMRAAAAPPAPLPAEVYGRLPNIDLLRLSPSGQRLAYIAVAGDRTQLVVKDLSGAVLISTPVGEAKVRRINWAGDDHLLVGVSTAQYLFREQGEYAQTLVVNLPAKKTFWVFADSQTILHSTYGYDGAVSNAGQWYGYFEGIRILKSRGFDPTLYALSYADLYRVNLDTGASDLVADGHQRPYAWAVDASGAVIAHSEYQQGGGDWTLRRDRPNPDILTTVRAPLGDIALGGLGRSPGTVVIDQPTPEEWNLADGAHTPLPVASDRPIEGYLFDPTSHQLVGVTVNEDRPEQEFFQPTLKARQAALRKALGASTWIVSWSADFQRLVLYTAGDGDAGTYWLAAGKSVSPYGYAYPEIPDASVGPSRMITYKAADGLEIHGVLTLPPGRAPHNLPLVVLPHGGPEAHDSLGFDYWAQAFAGHGYAVFQPNFRGSSGYGVAFRDAGFGEWGRKMQTDISDGVAELARQGVVDPKRACIVGGSYGGYAALAGVTVQHGLYRCAVAYGGVADLNYMLNWQDPGEDEPDTVQMRYLRKFMGARSNDDSALHDISPARLADRADAPILLIHGADDTVVPIGQSREMERELKHAGKPVEFILLKGEDHWLSRGSTRTAMLTAALDFVQRNNPAQ